MASSTDLDPTGTLVESSSILPTGMTLQQRRLRIGLRINGLLTSKTYVIPNPQDILLDKARTGMAASWKPLHIYPAMCQLLASTETCTAEQYKLLLDSVSGNNLVFYDSDHNYVPTKDIIVLLGQLAETTNPELFLMIGGDVTFRQALASFYKLHGVHYDPTSPSPRKTSRVDPVSKPSSANVESVLKDTFQEVRKQETQPKVATASISSATKQDKPDDYKSIEDIDFLSLEDLDVSKLRRRHISSLFAHVAIPSYRLKLVGWIRLISIARLHPKESNFPLDNRSQTQLMDEILKFFEKHQQSYHSLRKNCSAFHQWLLSYKNQQEWKQELLDAFDHHEPPTKNVDQKIKENFDKAQAAAREQAAAAAEKRSQSFHQNANVEVTKKKLTGLHSTKSFKTPERMFATTSRPQDISHLETPVSNNRSASNSPDLDALDLSRISEQDESEGSKDKDHHVVMPNRKPGILDFSMAKKSFDWQSFQRFERRDFNPTPEEIDDRRCQA